MGVRSSIVYVERNYAEQEPSMSDLGNNNILTAAGHLEAARDAFFSISRDLMTEEGIDWQDVEFYFDVSKKIEIIRRDVRAHSESENDKDSSVSNQPRTDDVEAEETGKPRAVASKKRKTDYPKYVIRNTSLIRIGLSRDRRAEYEHVVGTDELRKITERLKDFLTVDQFVVNEVQEGLDVPVYQTYLVTTLLRELGVLELIRRGVYRFADAEEKHLMPSEVHERVRGMYKNGN